MSKTKCCEFKTHYLARDSEQLVGIKRFGRLYENHIKNVLCLKST